MKVRLLRPMGRYGVREVADVSEATAVRWIAAGSAAAVGESEVARERPEGPRVDAVVTPLSSQPQPQSPPIGPAQVDVDAVPPALAEVAEVAQPKVELEPTEAPEEPAEAPPKSGPGSGKGAWLAYARARGVDVADDADRADVIAAVEAADSASGQE